MATRLCTMLSPSSASSSPATPPSSVEPVRRRPTRTTTTTVSVPATAAATRQPTSSTPNSLIPAAMSHLPSGGWTMNAPPPSGRHRAAIVVSSGVFARVACSTP